MEFCAQESPGCDFPKVSGVIKRGEVEQGRQAANRRDTIEIDLGEVLAILLERIRLILATGCFFALSALFVSEFIIPPVYESTTKIYILNKQESTALTYSDVQIGTHLTKDYAELITSRYVLEGVEQRLSLGLTYREMLKKIAVETPTDTRIVSISVEDEDPVMAMNIANAVREVASDHIQNVMDIEAVNVVETANMPIQKASPSVTRWTLIGGGLGVLLVCGIVVLQYLLDDTIKSSDDVQKYTGLSTLALIPVTEETDGARDNMKKKRKRKKRNRR